MWRLGSTEILRPVTLLMGVGWLIFVFSKSTIPADSGDGIQHFFYAQASWKEPAFFLHHWGKPFFILLSSPFAQLGFSGMVVFNILCYSLTVLVGYRIMERFKVDRVLQALFPLLLVITKDYSTTVLGGMTEVLFNLSIVVGALLFLRQKYLLFAVLVSFMPYMRGEGQLPLLIALVILIYVRQWRFIPFLLTGHLLYLLPGELVHGQFLWYFKKDPYAMKTGFYGSGNWNHYLLSYKNYIDNAGLIVVFLGTLALWIRWKIIVKQRELLLLGVYSYTIFLGILFVHSYFWATGTYASMGLTRLATQGMPLFLLVNLILISGFSIERINWIRLLSAGMSVGIVITLMMSKKFPIQPTDLEQLVITAAHSGSMEGSAGSRYFHFHPLLAFEQGDNPVLMNSRAVFFQSVDIEREKGQVFKPGDLIVWDSHFGPAEMNLPLSALESDTTRIQKLEEFNTSDLISSSGKEPGKVIIFRIRDQR
ncbi:MAG: hypothetical protein ACK45H_14675 [Bacteroidota bacterium]|jgi:hypothetical protein